MDYSPIAETAEDSGDDDVIPPYRRRPSSAALAVADADGRSDSSDDSDDINPPLFKRKVMESAPLTGGSSAGGGGGGSHGRTGRRFTLNPLIFAKEERDARRQSLAQLKLSYYPRNAERKSSTVSSTLPSVPVRSALARALSPNACSRSGVGEKKRVRKRRCYRRGESFLFGICRRAADRQSIGAVIRVRVREG